MSTDESDTLSPWHQSYISFDTETTGVGKDARIAEIAIIRFEGLEPVETWDTLLNPGDIDWESPGVTKALEVNHLTKEQLADAPSFKDTVDTIIKKLGIAPVLVAHNAEFDLRMLAQEEARLGLGAEARSAKSNLVLDTMLLDYSLVTGYLKRRLDVVCPRWGIELGNGHRARIDALACGRVLAKMVPKLPTSVDILRSKQDIAATEWRSICARAAKRAR